MPERNTLPEPERLRWAFKLAGLLWLAGGIYGVCHCTVVVWGHHEKPILSFLPIGACFLVAICGYGLFRVRRWAKRLASVVAPIYILGLLDFLLLVAFKRGFGVAFYVVAAWMLVGVYVVAILLIDESDNDRG
ncbi:MAG: hypothetical protein JWR26_1697 [Pedosphaera sp.]|nr:hypothetical protein [Pedosphaera sp.]